MPQPWQKLKSRYLIRRWWMNLREDHVRLPNGVELDEYHVLEYPHWTCVVCKTEDGEMVMVEQYRYGIDEVTLELPGGALEPDEDLLEGAKRELLEETGYASGEWTYLGHSAPDPTRHTNDAYFFFANNARKIDEQALDPGEDLHIHLISPEDLLHRADTSQIRHAVHLTAILWAAHRELI